MDYSRAIEKRDYAKIDRLNMLVDTKTFWDDVRKHTKKITSDHSLARWQCLAEYRYKEIFDIWENLMRKLYKEDRIVFRCTESFKGMYKAERDDIFADYIEIHSKDEVFILYNDKIKDKFGCVFYRINEFENFFFDGMVLVNSIIRAIDKGILEEVKDYKFPEVKIYSLEEVLPVYKY